MYTVKRAVAKLLWSITSTTIICAYVHKSPIIFTLKTLSATTSTLQHHGAQTFSLKNIIPTLYKKNHTCVVKTPNSWRLYCSERTTPVFLTWSSIMLLRQEWTLFKLHKASPQRNEFSPCKTLWLRWQQMSTQAYHDFDQIGVHLYTHTMTTVTHKLFPSQINMEVLILQSNLFMSFWQRMEEELPDTSKTSDNYWSVRLLQYLR